MSSQPASSYPRLVMIELVAALVLLSHAGVFLFPPNTFALSINFRAMRDIAPEWVWGSAFVVILALWAYAVWRRALRLRRIMLTIIALCLFWMGVSFFLSNLNTTIGYTLIILGAGTLAGRVGLR